MKWIYPLRSRRGNAMVEFALVAPLAMLVMAGTFQFGYTFYIYNQLQLSVRGAVRHASLVDYKGKSEACIAATKDAVKNLAVYGTTSPASNASPIIRGLTTTNVTVDFNTDVKAVPTNVTVNISNFSVNGVFMTFTFNGKPFASVPYAGRYSPSECE